MRSDSILFDQTIPAGESASLEKALSFRGRITRMTITHYPGQQKALQVKPFMLRAPDFFASLAKFSGTHQYFSGDDTTYTVAMNVPVGYQDKLCVDVSNVGAYDYDLYVLFEVEYE